MAVRKMNYQYSNAGKLNIFKRAFESVKDTICKNADNTHLILDALTYRNLGMYKEAAKAYRQAVEIQPDDAEAFYNLGNAYSEMGKFKKAIKAYKQAVSNKSRYADAIYKLSVAYGRIGRIKEAADTTRRLINIKPNFVPAYKNLSVFYWKSGMHKDAIMTLKRVLKIEPNDAEARYRLACYHIETHDRDSAFREYETLKESSSQYAMKLEKHF